MRCILFLHLLLWACFSQRENRTPLPGHLYYRLRVGGFNNQLVTVYMGVATALAFNMTYVLPHMLEDGQDGRSNRSHFPFSDYFDVDALKQLVPTMDVKAFVLQCRGKVQTCVWEPKVPKRPTKPTPTEEDIGFHNPLSDAKNIMRGNDFVRLRGHFGNRRCHGVFSKQYPVGFPGLGTYSDYANGHTYQGYDPKRNALFAQIRKHVVARKSLRDRARAFLMEHDLLDGRYLGLHVRRGDFTGDRCAGKKYGAPTPQHACPDDNHIVACLQNLFNMTASSSCQADSSAHPSAGHCATVVVAANLEDVDHVVAMLRARLPALRVLAFSAPPNATGVLRPDVQAVVEQTILGQAAAFMGNMISSWSATVFSARDVFLAQPNNLVWGECTAPALRGRLRRLLATHRTAPGAASTARPPGPSRNKP